MLFVFPRFAIHEWFLNSAIFNKYFFPKIEYLQNDSGFAVYLKHILYHLETLEFGLNRPVRRAISFAVFLSDVGVKKAWKQHFSITYLHTTVKRLYLSRIISNYLI